MKKPFFLAVILFAVGFVFSMLGFASWKIGLVVGGVYFVMAIIFIIPKLIQYQIRSARYKNGFQFMNNFLLTLSVHRNIPHTYEILEKQFSPELQNWSKRIEGMLPIEKIAYLSHYYHLEIYDLFVDFIKTYEQEGGEVLTMGELLLGSIREQSRSLTRDEFLYAKKISEFSVLWGLTFLILIATRFSLGDMYQRMLNNTLFLVLLGIFFLVFIVAFVLIIRAMFTISTPSKGGRGYEKVVVQPQKSRSRRQKNKN